MREDQAEGPSTAGQWHGRKMPPKMAQHLPTSWKAYPSGNMLQASDTSLIARALSSRHEPHPMGCTCPCQRPCTWQQSSWRRLTCPTGCKAASRSSGLPGQPCPPCGCWRRPPRCGRGCPESSKQHQRRQRPGGKPEARPWARCQRLRPVPCSNSGAPCKPNWPDPPCLAPRCQAWLPARLACAFIFGSSIRQSRKWPRWLTPNCLQVAGRQAGRRRRGRAKLPTWAGGHQEPCAIRSLGRSRACPALIPTALQCACLPLEAVCCALRPRAQRHDTAVEDEQVQ